MERPDDGLPAELRAPSRLHLKRFITAQVEQTEQFVLEDAEADALRAAAVEILLRGGERSLGRLLSRYRDWRQSLQGDIKDHFAADEWGRLFDFAIDHSVGASFGDSYLRWAVQE